MRWTTAIGALVLACGCTSGQTLEVNEAPSEEELLARNEHALGARIKERFGGEARLTAAIPQDGLTVLHVAREAAPVDSDAMLPLAIAVHDPKTDALRVAGEGFEYRDARLFADRTALVKTTGELEVVEATGERRMLADRIKGELSPARGASLLATQLTEADDEGNSRVVLVTATGEQKVLADGPGPDDRGSLSPDGETVLFVSGRTGVAAFFTTRLSGGEPVQLTNKALEIAEDGSEPLGFVPVPVNHARIEWIDATTVRFDAGGNELWTLNVKTGEATKVGGAR